MDEKKWEHNGPRFSPKPFGCGNHPNGDCWWNDRSLPVKILMIIGFTALGIGALFLFGLVIMKLWNSLMPEIFGLKELSYWQAWGLFLLSTILFKGMGSGGGHGRTERKRKKILRSHLSDLSDESPEDDDK